MTDEMNRAIRAAAGREPPKQSPHVDSGSQAEPGVSDLDVLKAIAAHEAGMATGLGRWLRGETAEEIREDAKTVARAVANHVAGQAGGFDGGARGRRIPAREPSVDGLIRATVEQRRSEVGRRASEFDQLRRQINGGGQDA